jgi:hypothetical protein
MRASSLIAALVACVGSGGLIVNGPAAHADTFQFSTDPGAHLVDGLPVDASATVTTSSGFLTITLTNLQSNPTSARQAISNFSFFIDAGLPGGTLSSSSGQELTVNSDGTFLTGSTVATGWSGIFACCVAIGVRDNSSTHLILGPPGGATYSQADSSIAGNSSNNPFLNQTATFTISDASISSSTTAGPSGLFLFGPAHELATPLPSALPLFATGLAGLGLLGWRRKKAAAG